jgi:hypothetical protein
MKDHVSMPGQFPIISFGGKEYVIVLRGPELNRMLLCSYGFNNPVMLRYVPLETCYIPSKQIGRDKLLRLWKYVSGFEDSKEEIPEIGDLFSRSRRSN